MTQAGATGTCFPLPRAVLFENEITNVKRKDV